jgi:hypothetical protein
MAEKDILGNSGIPKGSANATVRSRFKLDTTEFNKLAAGIKQIKADFQYLNQQLPNINNKLQKTLELMQGIAQVNGSVGTGGNTSSTGGITALPLSTGSLVSGNSGTQLQAYAPTVNNYFGPGFGLAGGDDGAGAAASASSRSYRGGAYALQALNTSIQAIDARMQNNYQRSLGADKLAVFYRQTQGMGQGQYVDMRRSMTGARLGYGGIDTLLSLQAQTGLNAQRNISGVEMLRTVSGYSYSTGDVANMMATMASAPVNNRMTMMLGTGMYGPGGQQRDIGQVIKDITKRSGLTNADVLKGARQAGSVTRSRLEAMGVPPDMIDMVLDYAESNVQFQKKTGSVDMYDPSKKKDRVAMGIEDSFATQAEETARVKEKRDEQFYRRQADNFADFEKNLQKVNEKLGQLEDTLSGLVGARIGSSVIGKGSLGSKLIGGGLMLGGVALTAATGGTAAPLGFGLSALGATLIAGDPMPGGKQNPGAKIPMGYGKTPKRISLNELAVHPEFSSLNTRFKERLMRMFSENPNVGLGDGIRSESDQRALFLSRYTEDPNGDVSWNGKRYRHSSGAPAAPPGKSMHEIGLAADLVGDLDWVQKNAARFGLKTFGDVLGEPWHIQPAELPNSRWEYEKQGAPWGMPAGAMRNATATDPTTGEPVGGVIVGDKVVSHPTGSLGGGYETYQGISLSDQMGAISANNQLLMGGVGGSDSVSAMSVTGTTTASTPQSVGTTPGGSLDPRDIARLMYKRGFRGKALANLLAIAGRESSWQPGAFNGKPPDESYGLFQINMLDTPKMKLGTSRRKQFNIERNDQLFDPKRNVNAAFILSGGGANLTPWNLDGNPMAKTEQWVPKAQAAIKELGYGQGDPMVPTRGGGGSVQVNGGSTITIAPNIYITSSGNNQQDARRMAQEIVQIMEKEVRKEALRSS